MHALPAEGRGKKTGDTGPLRHPAVGGTHIRGERPGRERVKRRSDIRRPRLVAGEKKAFNRPELAKHPPQDEHQCGEVAAANPPVHERREPLAVFLRIEAAHKCRRPRTHDSQQRLDRVQRAGDPSECQAGRAESDNLAILCRGITPDDVYGIAGGVQVIERAVEILEGLP